MDKLSRRRFLRSSALALAGVVSACAPKPAATPQREPTAAPTTGAPATEPAKVTPTEAPELSGKLSVMIWGSKQDIDEVRAVIAGYESRFPDVTLDIQEGGCGVDYGACKTLIAGGAMPDVFVPGDWLIPAMSQDGVLLVLDPYIDRDGVNLDDFYPAAMISLKGTDNKVLALPMGYHICVMYYNQDMFDKAGLPYPPADGNYTWHDVREWARKLTLDSKGNDANSSSFDPNDIVQWGMWTWPFTYIGFEPIILAFGGSVMTIPDGKKCNLEHPDSIRGMQFIQDLIWKDHSTMTPQADQENAGKYRFAAGEVAIMSAAAHWQTNIVLDQNPSLRNDVAAMPKEKAGNATHIYVTGWGVYSGTKVPELAWHFVRFVSTEGAGIEMGLIPAYKDLAMSDLFLKRPGEPEHLKEAFLDPAAWPLCIPPTVNNVHYAEIIGPDGIAPAIEEIYLNEKPAAEALAGVCEKVDAIMAS
ncbi:MAG: extracellular solute-binding protein [Anaerolineae bacterium]|nr:extracellular solute-binding protein [Anaerolineae bacterium]